MAVRLGNFLVEAGLEVLDARFAVVYNVEGICELSLDQHKWRVAAFFLADTHNCVERTAWALP